MDYYGYHEREGEEREVVWVLVRRDKDEIKIKKVSGRVGVRINFSLGLTAVTSNRGLWVYQGCINEKDRPILPSPMQYAPYSDSPAFVSVEMKTHGACALEGTYPACTPD